MRDGIAPGHAVATPPRSGVGPTVDQTASAGPWSRPDRCEVADHESEDHGAAGQGRGQYQDREGTVLHCAGGRGQQAEIEQCTDGLRGFYCGRDGGNDQKRAREEQHRREQEKGEDPRDDGGAGGAATMEANGSSTRRSGCERGLAA